MAGDRPPNIWKHTMILIAVAKRTDREASVFLGKEVFLIHHRWSANLYLKFKKAPMMDKELG